MVVSFATHDDQTPSQVRWWPAGGSSEAASTATGTVHVYSQLQFVDVMLVHPAIGPAEMSAEG